MLFRSKGEGGSLFKTLKGGLAQLTDALKPAAVIHGEVETIDRNRVRVNGEWIEAAHIILALPAHESARLLLPLDLELTSLLSQIPYSSSTTVALVYDRAKLNHPLNGFGFLVPKRERRALVACTWVGTKFHHRVPDHLAVLRCFLAGEGSVEDATRDIARLMGVTADPLFTTVNYWPRGMAQYTVGHARRLEAIRSRMCSYPTIHLIGNAYEGIGIPDCIRLAKQTAEALSVQSN